MFKRKKIDNVVISNEDLGADETNKTTERSDSVQEIISRRPAFVEKWALVIFTFVLLLLIAGTWFIHYPEIVESKGKLSALNAPKPIIPQQTGKLIRLFVKNEQKVKQGEMIGWIESTANAEEVIRLSTQLDSCLALLSRGSIEKVPSLFNNNIQQLGTIQNAYQTFVSSLQEFNDYLINGFYIRKKNRILEDMSTYKAINVILDNQKGMTEEDTLLSHNSFNSNEKLFKDNVISMEEYRTQKIKLLSKRMAIPQINSAILSNEAQQREKAKELEQLEHDVARQKMTFEQALLSLKSNVDLWLHQYTIQASFDGTVYFSLPLQQNQYVEQGKLLGYINPPDGESYVELFLPQNNLGKVDTGMNVQLRFSAYPYQEVGFVSGKLDYISKIASDSGFLATVRLCNGLKTNLNNTIHYKGGLKADAIVITKDVRLLTRIYSNIVKATSIGK